MDGQQNNVPSSLDEVRLDLGVPCGSEFPSLSTFVCPPWMDTENTLVIPEYKQCYTLANHTLASPATQDNASGSDTIDPSSAERKLSNSLCGAMVPSVYTNIPVLQEENTLSSRVSFSAQLKLPVPSGLHFPKSSSSFGFGFDSGFSLTNQLVHVPTPASFSCNDSDNIARFGPNIHMPTEIQLDHIPAPLDLFAGMVPSVYANQLLQEENTPASPISFSAQLNLPVCTGNHKLHFPKSSSSFGLGFDSCFSLTNQLVHVPSLASFSCNGLDNTASFNPSIHMPTEIQSAYSPVPLDFSLLSPNDHTTGNHVVFPSSGCISSLGSSGFLSIVNQKNTSSSFASSLSFSSNDAHAMRIQPSQFCNSPGAYKTCTQNFPNHDHTSHRTRFSSPARNPVGTPTLAPWSYYGANDQQIFGPSLLQVGQHSRKRSLIGFDVNFTCRECNEAFFSYHALGGHMSSHAKVRKLEASREPNTSHHT